MVLSKNHASFEFADRISEDYITCTTTEFILEFAETVMQFTHTFLTSTV
jgi:hypothetical protein